MNITAHPRVDTFTHTRRIHFSLRSWTRNVQQSSILSRPAWIEIDISHHKLKSNYSQKCFLGLLFVSILRILGFVTGGECFTRIVRNGCWDKLWGSLRAQLWIIVTISNLIPSLCPKNSATPCFPREFDLFAAFRGVNKFTFLHSSVRKLLAVEIHYGGIIDIYSSRWGRKRAEATPTQPLFEFIHCYQVLLAINHSEKSSYTFLCSTTFSSAFWGDSQEKFHARQVYRWRQLERMRKTYLTWWQQEMCVLHSPTTRSNLFHAVRFSLQNFHIFLPLMSTIRLCRGCLESFSAKREI